MARLLAPTSGAVYLDGKPIHQMSTREVASIMGVLPQSPTAPDAIVVADLVGRGRYPHQGWFSLMSWYLVEEISEAVHPTPEELPEELADCLHFAVELCILADVTPDDLQPIFQMDLFDDIPAQFQLIDVVSILGMAVNKLKGKHWKKQFAPPDMHQFQTLLANMLFRLVTVMWSHNVDPYAEYFKKHELNEVRIQTGY